MITKSTLQFAFFFFSLSLILLVVAGCSDKEATSGVANKTFEARPMLISGSNSIEAADEQQYNTETYDEIIENDFQNALANPKSTFSIDVDTASYSNVRRFINDGKRPPEGAVRIEEMINYFDYQYDEPESERPFSVHLDLSKCPWNDKHQLARIALKGKTFPRSKQPICNLVFLLDVSGSMGDANKLPLLKQAMKLLVKNLQDRDRIAIVTYAGSSGTLLDSTLVNNSAKIVNAIDSMTTGGRTNGGQGIQNAYQIAAKNFVEGEVNRVILCTDGDFNVGVTDQSSLVDMIQQNAKTGIELSVFGFGTGNYKDSTMEKLADRGNGNYGYIDSLLEAKKALSDQLSGTLVTIAKDVKIQVDFNPARVQSYRLIGYENRMLENEDFVDDTKDAGEIGAGHRVTALYELVPAGSENPVSSTDSESEFVSTTIKPSAEKSDVVLKVNLRYKLPSESVSEGFDVELVQTKDEALELPSGDFRFASAVAAYGMLLRDSKFKGQADWQFVLDAAKSSLGEDQHGYRAEFVNLVRQSSLLR